MVGRFNDEAGQLPALVAIGAKMKGRIQLNVLRKLRDERGVSSVIVAMSLIAVFGASMLSVDAGNMWQTRRNIVTATDATALQQASYFAYRTPAGRPGTSENCPTAIVDAWTDYLFRNGGSGTTPISCVATWGTNGVGYVVVQGKKVSKTRLGGLLGIGDTQPFSMSAAAWGFVGSLHPRPMGLCFMNDHFRQWQAYYNALQTGDIVTQNLYESMEDQGDVGHPASITLPTKGKGKGKGGGGGGGGGTVDPSPWLIPPKDGIIDYPDYGNRVDGVVHRVYFTKDNPDECGNQVPGNWGFMDFNGGSNQNQQELGTWIRYGYDENMVGVDDCDGDGGTRGGETGDTCYGDPGSSGQSLEDGLQLLVDNQVKFAIPIYDSATLQGSNAVYSIHAFVGVILRGFNMGNSESQRYFDFQFTTLQVSGICCSDQPAGGIDTGIRGFKLCDVDHDTQAGQTVATRCAIS